MRNGIDLFISFNWNDRHQTRDINQYLRRQGVVTFYAETDLTKGGSPSIYQNAYEALGNSRCFLLTLGVRGIGNSQQIEIDRAEVRHRAVKSDFTMFNLLLDGITAAELPSEVSKNKIFIYPTQRSSRQETSLEALSREIKIIGSVHEH